MNKKKMDAMVASYARAFAVAVTALMASGEKDPKILAIAGVAAIVGPAIRAINPKDSAFGMVADGVELEIDKLLKAEQTKKKAAPKKKA